MQTIFAKTNRDQKKLINWLKFFFGRREWISCLLQIIAGSSQMF